MSDALLYFRDPTHTVSGFPDPYSLPSGNKLLFTAPNDIMEKWSKTYSNTITTVPIPNNVANRSISIIDNGFGGASVTIYGRFLNSNADSDMQKLEIMSNMQQNDSHHVFGSFGLKSTNAPRYNSDPSDINGMMIKSFTFSRMHSAPKTMEFSVELVYGGKYVVS